MNDTTQASPSSRTCNYTACPGASCTCGCQRVASQAADQATNQATHQAACACGPQCQCGPGCSCPKS